MTEPENFKALDRDKPISPIYCVWEMGIVYHELQLSKKCLGTARRVSHKVEYLNDLFEDEV
ncbi:hypothetical protein [Chryseobacterium bernardetii]|uniref:hypothetical protein n=1 Tax=Chryseobacterium bernardetii TaxID=1241978 RepID=UPI001E327DAE|nr:hypothetical protein [Chryseobacterium bernardetii]